MNRLKAISELEEISKNTMYFLTAKEKAIKGREESIADFENYVLKQKSMSVDTSEDEKVLKSMYDSLYSFEVSPTDLITEHTYMNSMKEKINYLIGEDTKTYKALKSKIQSKEEQKKKVQKLIDAFENKINSIDEENEEKSKIRKEIIKSEDYLKQLDGELSSFSGNYQSYVEAEKKYDDEIQSLNTQYSENDAKLKEKLMKLDELYKKHASKHRDIVDDRLEGLSLEKKKEELILLNEQYGMSNIDILELDEQIKLLKDHIANHSNQESDDTEILEELRREVEQLESLVASQSNEIALLEQEKIWLENHSLSQEANIEGLRDKLNVWQSSYDEFKKLVDDLAKYVGYDLGDKLNAKGNEEVRDMSNPLGGLITRMNDIIKYVKNMPEEVEEDTVVEEETSPILNPYLVGMVALGGILLFNKN
jgi:chromosome segregation ATPase